MSTDVLTDAVSEMRCTKCGQTIGVAEQPSFSQIQCPACDAPQTVPARLAGFLLLELLGKGGMGAVYRAVDESLNRRVAVKVMLRSLGEDRKFVETFRREAQAAAALNHPNIVQIHSFGEEKGQPYIVMELISGGRLDRMIAGGEPLDESAALKIGVEVAEGLKAANDIGLIHGDVKPENILLDSNGVAKVVDFGLASFKDKTAATDGVWGTPYYIAPEKVRGQRVDARSDIYSLGATLYHALVAKPPFEGQTALDVVKARLEQPPPRLSEARPGVNPELAAIITRMLSPDPTLRYPTYTSLIGDMRKLQEALQPKARAASQPARRSGKIIIKKGRPAPPGESGKVPTGDLSAYQRKALGLSTGQAQAATAKPVKKRKALWIVIAVVAILAVAVGGTFAYQAHRKEAARRAAAAAEKAALAKARGGVLAAYGEMLTLASNGFARVAEARAFLASATNELALAEAAGASSNVPPATAELVAGVPDLRFMADELADALGDDDAELNRRAEEAATLNASAATAGVSTAVARLQDGLSELASIVQHAVADARDIRDDAGKTRGAAQDLHQKIAKAREAADVEAARIAAEKAETEKKAAGEAEAKRKAEEHQALVDAELAKVKGAREANAPLIKENQYKEACAAVCSAAGGLETDEGKKALAAVTNRISLLVDLRAFVIKNLNAEPYKWGWVSGAASLDVLGADETGVKLPGRTVPWSQVSVAQMLRFVKRAVGNPSVLRRELARMTLAAAVFCYENGGMKPAAEFAGKAVNLNADLQDAVKQMMPDLPAEGG